MIQNKKDHTQWLEQKMQEDEDYAQAYLQDNHKELHKHTISAPKQDILKFLDQEQLGPDTKNFYAYNLDLYVDVFLTKKENRQLVLDDMNKT